MIGELTNHLWQSTVFAGVVGLLALVLRKNRARVRFCLWLSASLKFFVPFALLISLGRELESVPAAQQIATQIATPSVSYTVESFTQPFSETLVSPAEMPAQVAAPDRLSKTLFLVWLCGFTAAVTMRLRAWRKVRAALRASTSLQVEWGVPVRASSALIEPGVVGVFRPTLLLPDGIVNRLTSSQLAAVVAHELCHVRRRDNLTSGLHMIVEAVFWFHPLVWWIGARLVEERERACDEEVLRRGNEPMDYAEGILNVCKFYQESPLISVPGVTGSDLKRRIEDIMKNRGDLKLGLGKILLLVLVGILAFTGPIAMGIVHATAQRALVPVPVAAVVRTVLGEPVFPAAIQAAPAQATQAPQATVKTTLQSVPDPKETFEVAAVKITETGPRGASGDIPFPCNGSGPQINPGRFAVAYVGLNRLIAWAYGRNCSVVERSGLLIGGPSWIRTTPFAIEATIPPGSPSYTVRQFLNGEAPILQKMLQNLLAERFKLTMHSEMKEVPAYNLVKAKDTGRLKLSDDQTPLDPGVPFDPVSRRGALSFSSSPTGVTSISANAIPIASLLETFGWMSDRPLLDKTSLNGLYDIAPFQFSVEVPAGFVAGAPTPLPGALSSSQLPQILDQLGLKLESTRASVEVQVIEHVEKPSEN